MRFNSRTTSVRKNDHGLGLGALVFTVFCLVVGGCGVALGQVREYTTPELVKEMTPGVVSIYTVTDDGADAGVGTGFVVSESGLIVTAYHVLDGYSRARVVTSGGASYDQIEVVNYDARRDIVVLKIKPRSGLKALALAQEE